MIWSQHITSTSSDDSVNFIREYIYQSIILTIHNSYILLKIVVFEDINKNGFRRWICRKNSYIRKYSMNFFWNYFHYKFKLFFRHMNLINSVRKNVFVFDMKLYMKNIKDMNLCIWKWYLFYFYHLLYVNL